MLLMNQKMGWMKQEFNWYLLQPSGALQTGDFTYKDKKFSFNQDGEMIKGWSYIRISC